jgi:hypothetical protein
MFVSTIKFERCIAATLMIDFDGAVKALIAHSHYGYPIPGEASDVVELYSF